MVSALHSRNWNNKRQKSWLHDKVAQHSLHVDRHQIDFTLLQAHAMAPPVSQQKMRQEHDLLLPAAPLDASWQCAPGTSVLAERYGHSVDSQAPGCACQ